MGYNKELKKRINGRLKQFRKGRKAEAKIMKAERKLLKKEKREKRLDAAFDNYRQAGMYNQASDDDLRHLVDIEDYIWRNKGYYDEDYLAELRERCVVISVGDEQ